MEPRGRLAVGNIPMEVTGPQIGKVGKGQTVWGAVVRTWHFTPKAMGRQGKIISRGLIGFVIYKDHTMLNIDSELKEVEMRSTKINYYLSQWSTEYMTKASVRVVALGVREPGVLNSLRTIWTGEWKTTW